MQGRKLILSVFVLLFSTAYAFSQSETFKPVVNNLALYKQKKDLKFLTAAKKSVDSLVTTHADSLDIKKSVYRALVNSTIAYEDSLNTLKQPATLFPQTVDLLEKICKNKKAVSYQDQIDYIKRCLANVYIRQGFQYMNTSDFVNAEQSFLKAQKYVPSFKQLNFYIAYSNNKLGNLQDAAKYYTNLIDADTARASYIEAAANIYQSIGDTAKAVATIQKGLKRFPNDKLLLLNAANIYNNQKAYGLLLPLLEPLLNSYPNSADVAFVAANCYDNLDQYKKRAKDLLKAAESSNPSALRAWAASWIDSLIRLSGLTLTPQLPVRVDDWIDQLENFTREKLAETRTLSAAQFVLARAHGLDRDRDVVRGLVDLLHRQRGQSPWVDFHAADGRRLDRSPPF